MAYDRSQAGPFWDFIQSVAGPHEGTGVDHPAFSYQHFAAPPPYGPPPHDGSGGPARGFGWGGPDFFGPPPHAFGGRGPHAPHHGRRDGSEEREHDGEKDIPHDGPEEEGELSAGEGSGPGGPGPRGFSRHGRHGRRGPHGHDFHARGGFRGGFHGRGGHGHGPRGEGRHRGPPPPFPSFSGYGAAAPFDLTALLSSLASHPIAQAIRTACEGAQNNNTQQGQREASSETLAADAGVENTFTPPIDIFSTPSAYVLHIALPGAKKEDVGVNWDSDKNELNVAGVVYRAGDEEFLQALTKAERKVGVFDRNVRLPPGEEEKEEVDSDGISAKLEDGVLVVTVPKVEKEWTEVKRVDIN